MYVTTALFPAVGTLSKDGQMIYISFKSMAFLEDIFERRKLMFRQVDKTATTGTDEMVVPAVFPGMVAHYAIPDADLGSQSQLLEQLQGSVDRRDVSIRIFGTDELEDLLGTDMLFCAMERINDHDSLRGKTVTFGL
jgi:hypothetical protein